MINKLLTITKNTFLETVRQPVYLIIIGFALLLFVLSPSISMYTMDEDIKLLREIGLSTLFLAGLFISAFAASAAVNEEMENKTIATVISKPISRWIFILGKFLGVAITVLIAHYILSIAMIAMIRHGVMETASDTHDWAVITAGAAAVLLTLLISAFLNYSYDWNFCAVTTVILTFACTGAGIFLFFIDKQWTFNPAANGFSRFDLYASILLFMAVLIITALAVMFSTRLNMILTLGCCVTAFLLGLISDYIFTRFADQHLWAKIGKLIAPNFQVFWVSDAIYEGTAVQPAYLAISGAYCLLYTAGIMFLAIALFQKRQIS